MLFVDGKTATIDELRTRFNVPEFKKEYMDFQLDPSQVKPDHANGGVKHSIAKEVLTSFRRVDPTTRQIVQIGFSDAPPIEDPKTKRIQYSPKRLTIEGYSQRYDTTQDAEKIIYLWLQPRCGESPFRKKNDPKFYNVFNPEVVAKKQNKADTLLTDALTYVKDAPIDGLRMTGKGLNLNLTQDMSDDEVRAMVTAKAKANPADFLKKINDKSIVWRGRVKDAIDTGIFEKKTRNQMPCWYWSKGDRTGKEICVIDNGADAYEFLLSFMLTAWDDFYHELGRVQMKGTNEKNLEAALETVVEADTLKESAIKDQLLKLLSRDAIYYNRENKTAYFVNGDAEEEITKIAKSKEWLNEIVAIAESNKALADKIYFKYRPVKNK